MITPQRKAKIKWHCRRGMLELDLIFQRFFNERIDFMEEEQIALFEALLEYPDPDLFSWLMGYEKSTQKEINEIVTYIRHCDSLPKIQ